MMEEPNMAFFAAAYDEADDLALRLARDGGATKEARIAVAVAMLSIAKETLIQVGGPNFAAQALYRAADNAATPQEPRP